MRVRFDRFYTYEELTETLEAWASEFPSLFRYEAIGTSYEGRDIWLGTVTNAETGPAEEKPAVFVHAQIHAMEFTGTTAALDLLDRLLHSDEPRVRHAVDTRTLNVIASTRLAMAAVLRLADVDGEAEVAIREAIALFELKGNVVAAARARDLLNVEVVA